VFISIVEAVRAFLALAKRQMLEQTQKDRTTNTNNSQTTPNLRTYGNA
jgi:hypothetical protein